MSTAEYVTGWQHIGIPVRNIAESERFYESLGFGQAYATTYQGQKVRFMRLSGMTIELYEEKETAGHPGAIDHIAINVTDIEKVFETIRNGSYHLLDENIDYRPFWDKGVRFFTIAGPNGEKVEFNQYL